MTSLVSDGNISVEGKKFYNVHLINTLDKEIKAGRDNQTFEIDRRIKLTCLNMSKPTGILPTFLSVLSYDA